MSKTVQNIYDAVASRLSGISSLSTTTTPSTTDCLRWINEEVLWILGICSEQNSELGRITTSISTLTPTITGVTQADPGVVTSTAHGLTDGDEVLIKGVVGMTELNGNRYIVANKAADTFELNDSDGNNIDTSAYTAYSSGGTAYKTKYTELSTAGVFVPAHMVDRDGRAFNGWIEKSNSREYLTLATEARSVDYDPQDVSEMEEWYLDGSNNVVFLAVPDDEYTVKIPHYPFPTALSLTTDTMPFGGVFDMIIIESVVIRAQNREEYELSVEQQWRQFLMERAVRAIHMRRNINKAVKAA